LITFRKTIAIELIAKQATKKSISHSFANVNGALSDQLNY